MAANMPQPKGKLKDIADKILKRPKDKEQTSPSRRKGGLIPVPPYYP